MLGLCATIVKLRRGADRARNNNLPHDALGPPHRNGDLREQLPRDAKPFRIQRLPANGLACPTVPECRVALIALIAVGLKDRPSRTSARGTVFLYQGSITRDLYLAHVRSVERVLGTPSRKPPYFLFRTTNSLAEMI
jgi:hypothetical protein